ncbi:MAG: thioesterase [Halieaceae bacterium]|nr:thioesterase [Halieaceae bacterium]
MTDPLARIEQLNEMAPDFIKLLGGCIIELDMDSQRVVFTFTVPLEFCHSGDVVQGGFVTAMLDAAMSHALFGTDDTISGVASLDIATQFIGVCRGQQPLQVTGRVKKATFKTAFLEADIEDEAGTLVSTAQSVAKLSRQPAEGQRSRYSLS